MFRVWLARKDSNLQSPDPESGALPLGHSPANRPTEYRILGRTGPRCLTGPRRGWMAPRRRSNDFLRTFVRPRPTSVVWLIQDTSKVSISSGTPTLPLIGSRRERFAGGRTRRSFSLYGQDKTLTCADCNQEFAFTASEQQFYADRQFTEPRRCPSCRAAKKAQRGDSGGSYSGGGSSGGYSGGGYSSGPREMFSATCSSCGREAQVPFRPSGAKPVYCSDCFSSQRGSSSRSSY